MAKQNDTSVLAQELSVKIGGNMVKINSNFRSLEEQKILEVGMDEFLKTYPSISDKRKSETFRDDMWHITALLQNPFIEITDEDFEYLLRHEAVSVRFSAIKRKEFCVSNISKELLDMLLNDSWPVISALAECDSVIPTEEQVKRGEERSDPGLVKKFKDIFRPRMERNMLLAKHASNGTAPISNKSTL